MRVPPREAAGLSGGGERFCDLFERFALGVDAEDDLDDSAEDHDPGAHEVADEEPGPARAVADQGAVEAGPNAPKICAMAKKTAIASARISIGQVSLTVR